MADRAIQRRQPGAKQRRSLVTPEGVDLSLRIGDGGQRAAAFFIDATIMVLTLIAFTFFVILVMATAASEEMSQIIWLLGFFLLRNFYFIGMEMGPRAATFGKRALGIRVAARNGGRLSADAVIARNLVRELEVYLPLTFLGFSAAEGTANGLMALVGFGWTAIFLFFPLFNRDRLRVGDLIAGTWVVNAPRRSLGYDLTTSDSIRQEFTFTDEQLDVYGVFELQTLEGVLRDSNPEAVGNVAWTIRNKIGGPFHGSDHEFLIAYYDAARARMERGLLFGKRRETKYDR